MRGRRSILSSRSKRRRTRMKIKSNVKTRELTHNNNQMVARASQRQTDLIENFVLPQLYCPFPSAVNPHAEAAGQHSLEWGQRFQIITPAVQKYFCETNIGLFTARLFPKASREALMVASDYHTWFFLKDDQT